VQRDSLKKMNWGESTCREGVSIDGKRKAKAEEAAHAEREKIVCFGLQKSAGET